MLGRLREKGTAMLPLVAHAEELRAWLEQQETFVGPHVRAKNMYSAFRYYDPNVVIRAPGLLDLCNHPVVIDVMEQWLGFVPCLYSINCWWSLHGHEPQCWHNQEWHVDTDADRFLCLFVYLTDVDSEEDGPQQIDKGGVWSILGKAGTMFVTDTLNKHRGLAPKNRDRLMLWARYGEGANSNSADLDGVTPLPVAEIPTDMTGTERDRMINRLLVKFP